MVIRIGVAAFACMILLLAGCETSARKPLAVPDLRGGYDFTICPLHDVPLEEGVEPIDSAHISWHPSYFEARTKTFPMAHTGDITDSEAEKALVVFCPECRKARQRWMDQEREAEQMRAESTE